MTLKTQMENDLSTFYDTDEHAETVVYDGSSIPGIIEYVIDEGLGQYAYGATLRVKVSDVALPVYRDTVVIGSDTWRVFESENRKARKTDDGLEWLIPISRAERATW